MKDQLNHSYTQVCLKKPIQTLLQFLMLCPFWLCLFARPWAEMTIHLADAYLSSAISFPSLFASLLDAG